MTRGPVALCRGTVLLRPDPRRVLAKLFLAGQDGLRLTTGSGTHTVARSKLASLQRGLAPVRLRL